jgi:nitrogen fixation protein FixH
MNIESINRKVSWSALLLAALIIIPAAQQHRINIAKRNEQAAATMLMRYTLENSALRMRLEGRGE